MYVSLTTPLAIPSRTVCRYATRVQNPPQSYSPPVASTPTRRFSFRASETLLPQTSSVFPRLNVARRGGGSLPEAGSHHSPPVTCQPVTPTTNPSPLPGYGWYALRRHTTRRAVAVAGNTQHRRDECSNSQSPCITARDQATLAAKLNSQQLQRRPREGVSVVEAVKAEERAAGAAMGKGGEGETTVVNERASRRRCVPGIRMGSIQPRSLCGAVTTSQYARG